MAASEALSLGYGGISRIRRASGLSRKAIALGISEIAEGNPMPGRIRRSGGGRKNLVERDPKLLASLDRLIEPGTRGDPESPLRWICKSTRSLAAQLTRQKHPVSHEKVAQILRDQNYSLQSNRKTEEGTDHPRPRCAIPSYQRPGEAGSDDEDAGYLGGHEEEGTARKLCQ
jgi:hypothetical protein